jgi:hypothetical protein
MLNLLKSELQEAAFMLVDDASRKEIHAKIVNCLVVLEQFEQSECLGSETEVELSEVNKVSRKLKRWARPERQNQYNSRILNAFLELKRTKKEPITESDIDNHLGENAWFATNFDQMKSISDKNHGKVFEVNGQQVTIWLPVEAAVREYEAQLFKNV